MKLDTITPTKNEVNLNPIVKIDGDVIEHEFSKFKNVKIDEKTDLAILEDTKKFLDDKIGIAINGDNIQYKYKSLIECSDNGTVIHADKLIVNNNNILDTIKFLEVKLSIFILLNCVLLNYILLHSIYGML
jgi:hypothetical protein